MYNSLLPKRIKSTNHYLRRYILSTLILLTTLFFGKSANAQDAPLISYVSNHTPITKGYGKSNFTLKVTFGGECNNIKVRIGLPKGVKYVPLSVHTISSSHGHTATYDALNSTPSSPIFDISGVSTLLGNIEFSIDRYADCEATQGSFFDSVFVTSSDCASASVIAPSGTTFPTYDINEPDLGILPVATITNAVVNLNTNRTITINNGGSNSATDTLRFYITYPNGGVKNSTIGNEIVANGTTFPSVLTINDTLFYKIFGVFGSTNPNLFENGESVVITEPIKILKCGNNLNASHYGASWGRNSENICKVTTVTGQIAMASGAPSYNQITSNRCVLPAVGGYSNLCEEFDFTVTLRNGGGGNATAAGMYNLQVDIGTATGSTINPYGLDTSLMSFYNVRIGSCGSTTAIPAGRVTWVANTGTTNSKATMHIDIRNLFTSDPDGVGGLEDLDGDGFFDDLAGGNKELTLLITAKAKEVECGYYKYIPNISARPRFNDMCDRSLVADQRNSTSGITITQQIGSVSHIPANIPSGQIVRFTGKLVTSSNINNLRTTNTRYRWKIALPPCFNIAPTPNATYHDTLVFSGSGSGEYILKSDATPSNHDTIIYTSRNNTLRNFSIDLAYGCSASCGSGNKTIWHSVEEINDITSPAPDGCNMWSKLFCHTISSDAKCPSPCGAGPLVYCPIVRRVDSSLGWTDNTLRTRQSASNITAFDLSKALYLDTIQITASMRQITNSDNLYIHFDLPQTTATSATGINKLKPVKVIGQLYRGGSAYGSPFNITTSTETSSSNTQFINWNLSSILPIGGLLAGDSLITTSYYVVSTNIGLPQLDIQSGGRWYYYNLSSGDEIYCDSWVPEMYLTGTHLVNGKNAFTASGCNETDLGATYHLARRFSSSGLQYENEVRPGFYIDSLVLQVPEPSYELVRVSFSNSIALTGQSAGHIMGNAFSAIVSPMYSVGSKYTYFNPNDINLLRYPNITTTNNYGGGIQVRLQPTCRATETSPISGKIYIRDYYYAYGPYGVEPPGLRYIMTTAANSSNVASGTGDVTNIAYSSTGAPNINLQNLTGQVQATAPIEEWTIQLGNSGTNPATYVWIAIPNHMNIDVLEVIDGSTVIPSTPYAGGNMYKLLTTTGIAQGTSKNYRIKFRYTTCTIDSLLILGGWNCGSFPTAPSAYLCGIDSMYLKVAPLQSQVQMGVVRQPGGGAEITLCSNDYTEIFINSSSVSYLRDPKLTFSLPEGINLLYTTAAVEYPRASGIVQNLPITCSGNNCYIDLTEHTGIGDLGIPGTSNDGGNINNRQALIRLDYKTDCEFVSGSSFRFTGWGNRVCGAPAVNNGVATAITNGLKIDGATITSTALMSLNFDGAISTISCGETVEFTSRIIPFGASSAPGDTIIYTLPEGLGYGGNFNVHSSSSTYPVVVSGGAPYATIVKVALTDIISESNSTTFSFDVIAEGAVCGDVHINSSYQRNGAILRCGSLPTDPLCSTPTRSIISTANSPTIKLNKPNLNILRMEKLDDSTKWTMGYWDNIVKIVYENNGTQAYTGNLDTIEFYCSTTSTTPFYRAALTKNLLVGAIDSDIYSIKIPTSACESFTGQFVEARIPAVTALGTPQCLCSGAAFLANDVLPLSLISLSINSSGCEAIINWKLNSSIVNEIAAVIIERSIDGISFEKTAELSTKQTSYSDITPFAGKWFYRLVIKYKNNKVEYSGVKRTQTNSCTNELVKVYPNPATQKLFISINGESKLQNFELFDITGRKVLEGNLKLNANNSIDLNNFSSGFYMLKVILDGQPFVQQIQLLKH
jgi:hypothetical protein